MAIDTAIQQRKMFKDISLNKLKYVIMTGDSIAYTMKYIDKQSSFKMHDRDDRVPEFPLMSKGLGANYLSDAIVDYHKADISRLYVTREGGHKVALPRYYREKIYSESEKRQQVDLIQVVVADRADAEFLEFNRLYSDGSISFEAWRESKKYGRYNHFYSNQKKRDV